jgi:hypothetical protein
MDSPNRQSSLPPFNRIPTIEALNQIPTGAKVLLARIANQCLYSDRSNDSHRWLAMKFNRSQWKSTGRWIRRLRDSGLIVVSKRSVGRQANEYKLGTKVYSDAALLKDIRCLSEALYGDRGLLSDWSNPASLGHGSLNISGTLVLSALTQIDAPVAIVELRQYLAPLISRNTFKRCLDKLVQFDIALIQVGVVQLHEMWEVNLTKFLEDNPASLPRLAQGNQSRQQDWSAILTYMTAGQITETEMIELRKLPCVFGGGPSNEQEHFPPQRFFRAHRLEPEIVNIFPACRKCNSERLGFIRSLPITRVIPFAEYSFTPDSDLKKIRAIGIERQRQQFEKAFQMRDKEAAVTAINTAISLSMATGQVRVSGSNRQSIKRRGTLVNSIGFERPPT